MNTISIRDILSQGWLNTKKNFSFLLTYTFVYFVISFILNKLGNGVDSLLVVLASIVISTMFSFGMYKIGLKLEDNLEISVDDFKNDFMNLLRFLGTSFLSGLFVFIGFILLIVPGFILMIRLSAISFIMVDKNIYGMKAIKESWRITKGFGFKIFCFLLLACLIMLVAIIPFGLGLLVAVPFIYLTGAVFYRKIDKLQPSVSVVTEENKV